MKKIFKYTIPVGNTVIVEMPEGAEILSVGNQSEEIQAWAMVNNSPNVDMESRKFRVFGTVHELPDDTSELLFLGTVLLFDRRVAFHVFEDLSD